MDVNVRSEAREILNSPDLASMETLISLLLRSISPPQRQEQEQEQQQQHDEQQQQQQHDEEQQQKQQEEQQQQQQQDEQQQRQKERLQESHAKIIYRCCTSLYPNALSLKLFHICHSCRQPPIRAHCINLLSSLLSQYQDSWTFISHMILTEIKPIILSCLEQENSMETAEVLSRILSNIASQVFQLENGVWHELLDYLVTSINSDFRKHLLVCRDLPLNINDDFLVPHIDKIHSSILQHLDSGDMDVWILAFGASLSLAIQLIGSEKEDLTEPLLDSIVNSVSKLVNDGRQAFLQEALEDLAPLTMEWLRRLNVAGLIANELKVVIRLVKRITKLDGIVEETRIAASGILELLGIEATGEVTQNEV